MIKSSPIISIILCVYNSEKFIIDCLRSIVDQTYKNLELIIIDDGSTDNSFSIMENYFLDKEINVKIIRQNNYGLTFSLNKALDLASGHYIARMDADDISLPTRLMDSLTFLEENNLDFLSTKSERFSGDKELSTVPNLRRNCLCTVVENLKFGNPFVHGTYFFKRSIFNDIKYNEKYRTAQDYDFIVRLCKSGQYKVGYLNKPLYRLRVDGNSSGRKSNSTQISNARRIAIEHFGTDRYLIPRYNGLKRILLSVWKRLVYER